MQALCHKSNARRRARQAATGVFLEPLYNHIDGAAKALRNAFYKVPLSTLYLWGLTGSNYYLFGLKVVKLQLLMQALYHTHFFGLTQAKLKGDVMIVIIVGMHRSGTSALGGMLHNNGIPMGDNGDFFPPPQRENPKGFFENRRFRVVNDHVLREAGYHVKTYDPLVPEWDGRVGSTAWRQMRHLIDYYDSQNKIWGWKDPRTCLTLWHWLRAIRHAHGSLNKVKVLLTDRNHEDIAQSMRKRGNKERLREGQFKELAEAYYTQALSALIRAEQPFLKVDFDRLICDTAHVVEDLTTYLGHPIPDISFIEPGLVTGELDRVAVLTKTKQRAAG